MIEDEQVLEIGNTLEIYADGVGRVIICGPNLKLQFWTWQEISGVLQRVAVMTLIRPAESVLYKDEIRQRIEAARARLLHSSVWHVLWLTLFDYEGWLPMLPLVLGPLH